MKLSTNTFAFFVFLASCTSVPLYSQAVSVNDADFETPGVSLLPPLGGVKPYDYSATPTYLTGSSGWYVSSPNGTGGVSLVNQGLFGALLGPITGDSSNQYLVLNESPLSITPLLGSALGGISQSITTTPGQTYLVTYQAGGLSLAVGATTAPLSAGVDGVTVTSPTGGALISVAIGTFQTQSFTFTANAAQSVLDFNEPNALIGNVGGIAIDNVAVTPVPEPRDSAAILMAVGIVVMIMRRLRKQGLALS